MEFEKPILHLRAWRRQVSTPDGRVLSQEKLADKIGYARGYIAKAETGDQNVSFAFLAAYAQGVGAPNIQSLFDKPEDFDQSTKELVRYYRSIKDDVGRQTIMSVARELAARSSGGDQK